MNSNYLLIKYDFLSVTYCLFNNTPLKFTLDNYHTEYTGGIHFFPFLNNSSKFICFCLYLLTPNSSHSKSPNAVWQFERTESLWINIRNGNFTVLSCCEESAKGECWGNGT
jgi:hypothetical protein